MHISGLLRPVIGIGLAPPLAQLLLELGQAFRLNFYRGILELRHVGGRPKVGHFQTFETTENQLLQIEQLCLGGNLNLLMLEAISNGNITQYEQ